MRIGVISDTHGLLRPEALDALRGVDRILHGGDIGKPEILAVLGRIAPVTVVRGNNDTDDWAGAIAESETLEVEGVRICMLHDVKEMKTDPAREGVRVVVSGHSHKPLVDERNGVLFVNPGSAGPRRFRLPVSVAVLDVADGHAEAHIVELDVPPPARKGRRQ